MEAEEVLKLLDSCWFEHGIFMSKHNLIPAPSAKFEDQRTDESEDPSAKAIVPNMQIRSSLSDRNLGRMNILKEEAAAAGKSASPRSVIIKPKLQKILSGKQINEFFAQVNSAQEKTPETIKRRKKWRKAGMRRSLSALEFEEVKGFMDLGFVFDEEDKNSSLVSVIPGLQKLGEMDNKKNTSQVSRPYLSEAWGGVLSDRMGYNNSLMNWTIPSVHNEINMKDHLKTWAHNVASTVR